MYSKNQSVNLIINGYTSEGMGVARIDSYVFFVQGAIKGEEVEAHILSVKSNIIYCKVTKVIKPSESRVNPDCPYFPRCGGCSLRHMSYTEELDFKRSRVHDAISRIGGVECDVLPTLPFDSRNRYRNKAIFPVGFENGAVFGFYRQHSHSIIPISDCLIHDKLSIKACRLICDWIDKYNIPVFNEETGRGIIRRVFTRIDKNAEKLLLCIIASCADIPKLEELVTSLKNEIPQLCGIVINVNADKNNTILGKKFVTVYGDAFIDDTLCGNKIRISPQSFYQINPIQAERLYETAAVCAEFEGSENLLDLYCGTGTITLYMARHVRHALGIEIVPEAIEDAKKNAAINEINNVSFICADASDTENALNNIGFIPDVIVVDPPRKGLSREVTDLILSIGPKKVIYISCHPETLARDVSMLKDKYNISHCKPVDMFPATNHIETVLCLTKKNI